MIDIWVFLLQLRCATFWWKVTVIPMIRKNIGERLFAVRCDIIHTILSGIWYGPDEYAVYLILCFLILKVMEMSTLKWEKWIVILILIFVSLYSDWALLAPVFTILFAKSKGNRIKQQYHLE